MTSAALKRIGRVRHMIQRVGDLRAALSPVPILQHVRHKLILRFPVEWHPERWLTTSNPTATTDGGATDTWSFMAFSRGAKNCIGEKFARAEMAVLLIKLLGHFDLKLCREEGVEGSESPPSHLDVFYSFTGAISTGIWASLEEVKV